MQSEDPRARADSLLEEAHAITREDVHLNREWAVRRRVTSDGARILTHCNAGALATAGHGTALGLSAPL